MPLEEIKEPKKRYTEIGTDREVCWSWGKVGACVLRAANS